MIEPSKDKKQRYINGLNEYKKKRTIGIVPEKCSLKELEDFVCTLFQGIDRGEKMFLSKLLS